MEDYSYIMCETHNHQITTVCTRDNCDLTRSCCEKCKYQHQGHQDDLIQLNDLYNKKKDYDKQFYDIQNKINTNLKLLQSGLESILIKSPTLIKNPAEVEILVLYCQGLKEFINNFHQILKTINPVLLEAQTILNKTTLKISQTFELKYNTNLNKDKSIYKTAYQNIINNFSEIHSNLKIEKQNLETPTQGQQEYNDEIMAQKQAFQPILKQVPQEYPQSQNIYQEQQKQLQNALNLENKKNRIDIISNDQQQNYVQSQYEWENQLQSKIYSQYSTISRLLFQDIRFSSQQKSFKVTLSKDQMQAQGNQFVLCENFNENKQIIQFAFQIVSGEKVFVGACHKDIIKLNKYEANFRKEIIGHGAYLITSYGYSFSHTDQQINGNKLTFQFSNSDIVAVEIDKNSNRIKWQVYDEKDKSNFDKNKRFSMQFDPKDDLCPCVCLLQNSKVQIYKEED